MIEPERSTRCVSVSAEWTNNIAARLAPQEGEEFKRALAYAVVGQLFQVAENLGARPIRNTLREEDGGWKVDIK